MSLLPLRTYRQVQRDRWGPRDCISPLALATIQQLDPIYVDVPQCTTDLLRLRRRLEATASIQMGRTRTQSDSFWRRHSIVGRGASFRDVTVDPSTGFRCPAGGLSNRRGSSCRKMFVPAVVKEGTNASSYPYSPQPYRAIRKGTPSALMWTMKRKNPTAEARSRPRYTTTSGWSRQVLNPAIGWSWRYAKSAAWHFRQGYPF